MENTVKTFTETVPLFGKISRLIQRLPEVFQEKRGRSEYNKHILRNLPEIAAVRPNSSNVDEMLFRFLCISIEFNVERAKKHAGRELCGKFLAWHLAYDLQACLLAFEALHDIRFLELFAKTYPAVLDLRDSEVGQYDQVRQKYAKAWGSNRFTRNKESWMSLDAFTGMLLFPGAQFCRLIQSSTDVPEELVRLANIFQVAVIEGLDEFQADWRDGPNAEEGYYWDPYLNDIAPLNHMLALGRVHVELARMPGRSWNLDKATRLAHFFRNRIVHLSNDSYTWTYWPKHSSESPEQSIGEDVTHAHINVHFAYLAFRSGIVFDSLDMKRFANTLTKNVLKSGGIPASNVDGTGDFGVNYEGLHSWVIFSRFAKEVPDYMEKITYQYPTHFPLGWLSYATGPFAVATVLAEARQQTNS